MKRAKRIIMLLLLAILVLCVGIVVPVLAQENAPTFEIGNYQGSCGDQIQVPVLIRNNPGILSIKLKISYDTTRIELISVDAGSMNSGSFQKPQRLTNPISLTWFNGKENYMDSDFTFATLTFSIKDDAEAGDASIIIAYEEDDVFKYLMPIDKTNPQYEFGGFAVVDGKITVLPQHSFNYNIEPAFVWNNDNSCTAVFSCICGCGKTDKKECNVTRTEEDGVDCQTRGKTIYTAIYGNYNATKTVDGVYGNHIPGENTTCTKPQICIVCKTILKVSLGHTPKDPVKENHIDATCTDNGGYDSVVYCLRCGEKLNTVHVSVPVKGHSFINQASKQLAKAATCTDAAKYYAKCNNCDVVSDSIMVSVGEPAGHHYVAPVFEWGADLSSVTASVVCEACGHNVKGKSDDVSWTTSTGKLTAVAEISLNDRTYTDKIEIFAVVNDGLITVSLPFVVQNVTIYAASYNENGSMLDCTFANVENGTSSLKISGNRVKLFFLKTDNYIPVTPCMLAKS